MFQKLSEREEFLAKTVVNIAYNIHKQIGPGLLESVYEKCFGHELYNNNILFERQKEVSIIYNELKIADGLRLDLLIENLLIVELKAQENFHPVWEAQLISYLKLTNANQE